MRGAEEQLIVCGVYVAREANLEGRQYTSMQQPGNLPHISSVVFLFGGGLVCTEGTGTGFCSIMHDNKSQRPVVYCGKLLRLWPK